jgi:hypothetical protein
MNPIAQQTITFFQSDVPPLRVGSYTLTATQTVPGQAPGSFSASNTFVVQGPRFSFPQDAINSVFPPANAVGEYDGVLPHVVFTQRTLPWQRALKLHPLSLQGGTRSYLPAPDYEESPWLAVLLFNDDLAPAVTRLTARDLVAPGVSFSAPASGNGTLPDHVLSYSTATLVPLGYGETPDDACNVIDIPLAAFNQAAPCAADVQFLGHIREVDTADGSEAAHDQQQFAVVVGNRVPRIGKTTHAYLVSLENFADYLPDTNGNASALIGAGIHTVRLLCYRAWSYTANDLDQKLQTLLENLNKPNGAQGLTTLQLPVNGAVPDAQAVNDAMSAQTAGHLSAAQAGVLVKNAMAMGYTACNHHLRHGGNTVSLYRGPLAPFPVASTIALPIAGADAANSYNPQAGLFDVSYGMAWQLGQLLALQNTGFANGLYEWKRSQNQQAAMLAEQELIAALYAKTGLVESIMRPRQRAVQSASTELPAALGDWLGKLALLQGVPFNYLVPDERMLPPESLRFFHLDLNWIDALIDGAFSIGRTTTAQSQADRAHVAKARLAGYRAMYRQRRNRAAVTPLFDQAGANPVTGFLLRSQVVAGWPNLRIKGYSDLSCTNELGKLRLLQLSSQVTLGLFAGALQLLVIEEPPEQMHLGVEGQPGCYSTTLRAVQGDRPGQQFPHQASGAPQLPCNPDGKLAIACVAARADQQTLQVAAAADSIQDRLSNSFSQSFPHGFTSAEFALEMTKGVVRVEYQITA